MSCCNNNAEDLHKITQDYYGKQLQGSKDLKTNCCKCSEKPPKYIREAISLLHEDIISHYYGCGLVIPDLLEGLTCLDLGCGAGHDVYILSKLVGEKGKIYGVDMTEEQLNIAEKYKEYQTKVYGYSKPNVEFIKGYIENLEAIPDNSIDLIVSNCVVNLSPNKKDVFKEAYRVLKPGGEMYFSDVYSDRRIPEKLLHDPILHGECLSGALYWNDFLSLVKTVGFKSPRLVKDRPLSITNKDIEKLIGFAKFYSATYRLFKIAELDNTDGEDYGLKIKYKGTIETCPDIFILDKENKFEKGKEYNICGNTYRILNESRFRKHFEFYGNFEIHYGIMNNCSSIFPFNKEKCCMESENMNDMENNDNTYEDNYYYQYGPWDYNYYGYNHDNYYY